MQVDKPKIAEMDVAGRMDDSRMDQTGLVGMALPARQKAQQIHLASIHTGCLDSIVDSCSCLISPRIVTAALFPAVDSLLYLVDSCL
jgi:hypothetical protein